MVKGSLPFIYKNKTTLIPLVMNLHTTARCFVLKEKIMTLVRDGKIIIDANDTAEANHASAKIDHKKGSTT